MFLNVDFSSDMSIETLAEQESLGGHKTTIVNLPALLTSAKSHIVII